jgi:hypothetical protein
MLILLFSNSTSNFNAAEENNLAFFGIKKKLKASINQCKVTIMAT